MKSLIFVFAFITSVQSFALEAPVITRLVKEDIAQGKLISGKRSVEKLEFVTCEETTCLLNFQYFTDGCHQDFCWDLECNGQIGFDLETVESWIVDQKCLDL